jgi:sugar/nucleoside kinase (ribokinase family)
VATKPELVIIGQVTIDDVVPATPGPWRRQMGGSSLYALAGARLWLEPGRIGLLARIGQGYPFEVERLLRAAGLKHIALPRFASEHLIEWLIYEPDGTRRSLPRNRSALHSGAEGSRSIASYDDLRLDFAAAADQLPRDWLPVAAIHLCPQIDPRHPDSLRSLRSAAKWISVDPSPHYSRTMSVEELAHYLEGATAVLPSAQEVSSLLERFEPAALALQLNQAGFAEVLIKRGEEPVVLAEAGGVHCLPVVNTRVVDPTGAGDSFCGAYAACRLVGYSCFESARRAIATAALVVSCSGVEAAMQLLVPTL